MPPPGRFRRLLGLVRKLVDYGRELVSTLQQEPPADNHRPIKLQFGTADIALILRRITLGLRRAAALEYRLIDCAELEATAKPLTHAAKPPSVRPRRPARPRAPRPRPDPSLADRLPSVEEIAAEVRRRPIGAVLADICDDLGIVASHPLWEELRDALIDHRGNFAGLVSRMLDRVLTPEIIPAGTPLTEHFQPHLDMLLAARPP